MQLQNLQNLQNEEEVGCECDPDINQDGEVEQDDGVGDVGERGVI